MHPPLSLRKKSITITFDVPCEFFSIPFFSVPWEVIIILMFVFATSFIFFIILPHVYEPKYIT